MSGTVEEIEEHIAAGRPTMLYFSSQPVAMDTVEIEQIQRLKKFKEACQSRGLYQSYDSHSDFKDKFYRHLQLKINENALFETDDDDTTHREIIESRTQLPSLSAEGRALLKEASKDPGGIIIYARYLGGTTIQTNGKNLIPSDERREVAKWEDALAQLNSNGLITDRGYKGEVYEITNLGYQVADMIVL
ncbi:hypothetical protein PZ739_19320 [Pseudomonas kermanshahensis]|uniref:hypothetical protein n=1 Tax=Pseudomonas kermanshahensis TaxID=2745482 RepID=UPI0023DAAB80|nr:hypothetical protein [Pseudomonas kermanshahensis]WEL53972.1 hypothetical protein PZ739_19320 [Pseudomonas kermanshahensis]